MLSIGIGGSALGPEFVADALGHPLTDKMYVHFIDNTDPEGIARVLASLEGERAETLTIVCTKSGGTPETRNGMMLVSEAYKAAGLEFNQHAVAITMPGSKMDKVAVDGKWLARFPMFDWIGGRTSELSAVGLLPAALQGVDIQAMLDGAAAIDIATRSHDTAKNPAAFSPPLMWHHATNGKGEKDMVVLPYKDRLLLFSRYLQQLVMESLGKRLDLDGKRVDQGINVFGNKGSTDQHAYVQQLRDGVNNFFITFIRVLKDGGRKNRSRTRRNPRRFPAGLFARHPRGAVRQRSTVDHDYDSGSNPAHGGCADRAVRASGWILRLACKRKRLPPTRRGSRQKGCGIDSGNADARCWLRLTSIPQTAEDIARKKKNRFAGFLPRRCFCCWSICRPTDGSNPVPRRPDESIRRLRRMRWREGRRVAR